MHSTWSDWEFTAILVTYKACVYILKVQLTKMLGNVWKGMKIIYFSKILAILGAFLKIGHLRLCFLYFRLFNTFDSNQMFDKSLPMTGFKPRISGVGGDISTTELQPLPIGWLFTSTYLSFPQPNPLLRLKETHWYWGVEGLAANLTHSLQYVFTTLEWLGSQVHI